MKNYDERIESIFRKYDEKLEAKRRKSALVRRTAFSLSGICAAAIVGIFVLKMPHKTDIPNPGLILPQESTTSVTEDSSVANTTVPVTTSVRVDTTKTTVTATKTVKNTATETTKTEKETTSAAKTSTNAETTEANTTETTAAPVTEPPTQQTSVIETTVTITMTTQSSANTTITTHYDTHITTSVTTTSGSHDTGEGYPKVIINGVTYYCGAVDDGFDEFTADEFLGYGTDFEGIYHDNPTIRYYTVLENENIVIAVTKIGAQIPFYKLQ